MKQSATFRFWGAHILTAFAADMPYILAGVHAQAATTCAKKWQQQQTPYFGSSSIFIFSVGHGQLITVGTVDLNRNSRVPSSFRVIWNRRHRIDVGLYIWLDHRPHSILIIDDGVLTWDKFGIAILLKVAFISLKILRHFEINTRRNIIIQNGILISMGLLIN